MTNNRIQKPFKLILKENNHDRYANSKKYAKGTFTPSNIPIKQKLSINNIRQGF
jgi:hypothetical protein